MIVSVQESAAEDECVKHSSSGEQSMRQTSADVESDHSPGWEAASMPDAVASDSRRSDGSASGAQLEQYG